MNFQSDENMNINHKTQPEVGERMNDVHFLSKLSDLAQPHPPLGSGALNTPFSEPKGLRFLFALEATTSWVAFSLASYS